jgi:hypothetical protein
MMRMNGMPKSRGFLRSLLFSGETLRGRDGRVGIEDCTQVLVFEFDAPTTDVIA